MQTLDPIGDYQRHFNELTTLSGQLLSRLDYVRPLEPLTCSLVDELRLFAGSVTPRDDKKLLINMFAETMRQIEAALLQNHETVLLSVLAPFREGDNSLQIPADKLHRLMFRVCCKFIIDHEFSHILCGHLRKNADKPGGAQHCEMNLLGRTEPGEQQQQEAPDEQTLEAYIDEFEADNTAVEWFFEEVLMPEFLETLDSCEELPRHAPVRSLMQLEDGHRILAFRIVLSAVWLVIGIIEQRRAPKQSATHPLPAARLYGSIDMLMHTFSWVGESYTDAAGILRGKLGDTQRANIMTFLRTVLLPVAKSMKMLRDPLSGKLLQIILPDTSGEDEILEQIMLLDLYGLMFGAELQSEGARQLEELQALRVAYTHKCRPHRYLRRMYDD